jgi:hypothetical protein
MQLKIVEMSLTLGRILLIKKYCMKPIFAKQT